MPSFEWLPIFSAVRQPSGSGIARRSMRRGRSTLLFQEEPVADLLALNANELSDRLTATPDGAASLDGLGDMLARDRMQDIAAAGKFLWPLPDKGLARRAYRIKAPTLILWGEQDRINPPSYAADFQGLIAGSQTGTVPNAGHLLMLEQPDAFADAVVAFLIKED